ncbi:MAG: flagellar motor switch protein FliN [Phycisphaeraceae bacterium]
MAEQPESNPQPTDAEADTQDAGEMAEQALGGAQKAVDELKQGDGDQPQQEPASDADPEPGTTPDPQSQESGGGGGGANVELPSFQKVLADVEESGIGLLHDVDLNVKIELGRTHMLVEDVLRLASGSVVELDKLAGDPVDIYVNERLVARGEVLVLNDNFCVRISEIVAELEEDRPGQEGDDSEELATPVGDPDAPRSTGG